MSGDSHKARQLLHGNRKILVSFDLLGCSTQSNSYFGYLKQTTQAALKCFAPLKMRSEHCGGFFFFVLDCHRILRPILLQILQVTPLASNPSVILTKQTNYWASSNPVFRFCVKSNHLTYWKFYRVRCISNCKDGVSSSSVDCHIRPPETEACWIGSAYSLKFDLFHRNPNESRSLWMKVTEAYIIRVKGLFSHLLKHCEFSRHFELLTVVGYCRKVISDSDFCTVG